VFRNFAISNVIFVKIGLETLASCKPCPSVYFPSFLKKIHVFSTSHDTFSPRRETGRSLFASVRETIDGCLFAFFSFETTNPTRETDGCRCTARCQPARSHCRTARHRPGCAASPRHHSARRQCHYNTVGHHCTHHPGSVEVAQVLAAS
jgi:hypothetical protein